MSDSGNCQEQKQLLCNRKKDVSVYNLPGRNQFLVEAEMRDGVHHMKLRMVVDEPALIIAEISCEMKSIPDPICLQAENYLQCMVGKRVTAGLTRSLNGLSTKGCSHLSNLFYEACYDVLLGQSIYGKASLDSAFPGITEEQIYRIFMWFKPDLKNSCVRYDENAAFMQQVKAAELPPGAEKLKAVAAELRN